MKKKAVMLLLGCTVMSAAVGGSVQAKTYGWDNGRGIISYYVSDGDTESEEDFVTSGAATEIFKSVEAVEVDEAEADPDYTAAMQNEIAEYGKYGVSYDADKDEITYQGKRVRWLIDEKKNGTCSAIQMPEGEIDLYTTRTADGRLAGVRTATQEEYDERTKADAEAVLVEDAECTYVIEGEDGEVLWVDTAGIEMEEDGNMIYTFSDGSTVYRAGDGDTAAAASISEAASEDGSPAAGLTENEEKVREYGEAGISYDEKDGCWLLGDDEVYWLMDEDGSMYTNGSEEAKENKIYVIVKRDGDGSIKEVKMATIEDVMEAKIDRDMAEAEH